MSEISQIGEDSASSEMDVGEKARALAAALAAVGAGAGAGAGASAGLVGRMVDSSQADDRRMIALVRARRLLYARNNMPVASYYAQVKRLWEEVAEEMGRSVAEVRRKWSHIRNSYSRHLRNEVGGARTGRGRVVSRWYLADELEFLKEHMATDTRSVSSPSLYYGTTPTSFLEVDMSEAGASANASAEPVEVKPFATEAWFGLGAAAAQFQSPAEPKPEPLSVYSGGEESSSSYNAAQEEESLYFQFFRGLYGDYSELSARRRRLFRRKCLTLLHGLLDEQDASEATQATPTMQAAPATNARARPSHHAPAPRASSPERVEAILPND